MPRQAFQAPHQQPPGVEGPRFQDQSVDHIEHRGRIGIVIPIQGSHEAKPFFPRQRFQ